MIGANRWRITICVTGLCVLRRKTCRKRVGRRYSCFGRRFAWFYRSVVSCGQGFVPISWNIVDLFDGDLTTEDLVIVVTHLDPIVDIAIQEMQDIVDHLPPIYRDAFDRFFEQITQQQSGLPGNKK